MTDPAKPADKPAEIPVPPPPAKEEDKTVLEKAKDVVLPGEKSGTEPVSEDDAKKLEERCLCMAITVMVLSIFGINVFSFLFSLFMLISVNGDETTRYHWKRVVRIFYIVSLVVLIVGVIVFIIILIIACVRGRGYTIAFSIYIIVMIVLQFIFSIIGYSKLAALTDKPIHAPPAGHDLPNYSKLDS